MKVPRREDLRGGLTEPSAVLVEPGIDPDEIHSLKVDRLTGVRINGPVYVKAVHPAAVPVGVVVRIVVGIGPVLEHILKVVRPVSRNVLGVFAVKEDALPFIKHARILLCDDVKTTGATLNECAKTLLIAGADEVFCLTATTVKKSYKKPER